MLFKVLYRKCGLICAFKKASSALALSASALAALSSTLRHCFTICKAPLIDQIITNSIKLTISVWSFGCIPGPPKGGGGRMPSVGEPSGGGKGTTRAEGGDSPEGIEPAGKFF